MGSVTFTRTSTPSVNGYVTIDVEVNYSETYNINENKTTVAITSVRIRNRNYYIGSCVIKGRVKINGTTVASFSPGTSAGAQANVGTSFVAITGGTLGSAVVSHNTDGSGSFTLTLDEAENPGTFTGFFGYKDASYKVGIATPSNKTVNLTTRPRVSTVSATDAYIGENVTITLSRYNSDFTHTVKVSCAGNTETLVTKSSTYPTLTWTPALATYAPLITNAMSATATVTCETYNGDTLVGQSTATCTLTLKAADVAPSVSLATADPTGNLTTYGKYVVSKSKITATSTPTLAYGASLVSTVISANGAQYNASPATTDFILSASNTTVSVTITDSRGQTATATATIQIYDYAAPQIISMAAHRCNSDGTDNNAGAYFKVAYSIVITALGNNNSKTLKVKYKKRSASTYTETSFTPTAYTETSATSAIAADTNATYDIVVELTDDFGTASVSLVLPTASTRMNWGAGENGGVAIGKVSEHDKTLEIADDWAVKSKGIVDLIYPVGAIYMSVNSTSPATLFGGTWAAIEDTFLLSAGSTYTAGDTGGEATHTLTKDELPAENLGINAGTNWLGYRNTNASTGNGIAGLGAKAGTAIKTDNMGSGQAHNNMPPYLVVYVWKRTA